MTTQQLQACREQNPAYTWLGTPTRQAMWGPDPCQAEVDAVRGATVEDQAAQQAAQIAQAPTSQDLASAPAPQLSSSYDPVGNTDPAIPDSEGIIPNPDLTNLWSPMDVDDVLLRILEDAEMEGSEEWLLRMIWLLEDLEADLRATGKWTPWGSKPKAKWLNIKLNPKNEKWVGKFQP